MAQHGKESVPIYAHILLLMSSSWPLSSESSSSWSPGGLVWTDTVGLRSEQSRIQHLKIRDNGAQNTDLPTISCEIGLGIEKKSIVNFFYREFMSGVFGLKNTQSQVERL